MSDPNEIKGQFVNYFLISLSGSTNNTNDIDIQNWLIDMPELNPNQVDCLNQPSIEEKVKNAFLI